MRTETLFAFLLGVVALAPVARGQTAETKVPAARTGPVELAIIGASVSAGFVDGPLTGGSPDNRTAPLQTILRGWVRDVDGKVESRADLSFFLDPLTKGAQQVDRCLGDGECPDVVVAVDFLFWYGYGYVHGDDEQQARLDRLEQGLRQLDRFGCAVVLGDLPDMQGAARRMISPKQIPDAAILAALNERIAAWAAERPRMHVFPLRQLVTRMKTEGVELELEDGAVRVPPGGLLQGDRLHANRLGMAFLGHLLQAAIGGALRGPGGRGADVELPEFVLDEFVEVARAGTELDDVRASTGK